jgi:uncharacterized protein YbdZ (MbtH family)
MAVGAGWRCGISRDEGQAMAVAWVQGHWRRAQDLAFPGHPVKDAESAVA